MTVAGFSVNGKFRSESIGAGAEQRDAFYQIQADAMSTAPAVLQAEAAVILNLP